MMVEKLKILFWIILAILFITWISSDNDRSSSPEKVNGGTTYTTPAIYEYPSPYSTPLEFNGYPCTEDCSGHEAGYEWAEENEIEDSYDCGGNSNSFIEGCESYVEENYSEYEEEEDYYNY